MRASRRRAVLGSAAFLVVAPGVAAGLVPWLLTGWEFEQPIEPWGPFHVAGGLIMFAGIGGVLATFARFALEGRGTPAPIAPTEKLVIGGLYRRVRNPMYSSVLAAIVGQALVFGQPILLGYAAIFFGAVATFARLYEEPALRERFGERYEEYRREVPAWVPRVRPWKG